MTLDEAIEHAKEVAETCDDPACAADHMQLVEWLRKVRIYEKAKKMSASAIHKLKDENARLRSCLSDDAENEKLVVGENRELRELLKTSMQQTEELCRKIHPKCHECPLLLDDECRKVMTRNDARELGIEVK